MKPPVQVNIHEAKPRLSQPAAQVGTGDEDAVAQAQSPVVAPEKGGGQRPRRVLGTLAAQLNSLGDYNAPLPEELLDGFEGRL
jgi:hypothetical protein